MVQSAKYIVGTSGFSFAHWVGHFYPAGTKPLDMFELYARQFAMVELNFTFYSMPGERTFQSLLDKSPAQFEFWVKVNRQISHEGKLEPADMFLSATEVLRKANKLGGLIMQFPQSFKRTVDNRRYLASAIERFAGWPLAVEFRDCSWDHPATYDGLRQRGAILVVPDAPPIERLFRPSPAATGPIAYLRLHSRNADKWYKGEQERYDYNYSEQELREVIAAWEGVEGQVDRVYTMFNNCFQGQAARNAMDMRRILGQVEEGDATEE